MSFWMFWILSLEDLSGMQSELKAILGSYLKVKSRKRAGTELEVECLPSMYDILDFILIITHMQFLLLHLSFLNLGSCLY